MVLDLQLHETPEAAHQDGGYGRDQGTRSRRKRGRRGERRRLRRVL
jgi:hypothetical protein